RRDGGAHADWLAHRHAVDTCRHVLQPGSPEDGWRGASDLDALDRATDAAARFVQCLAVLRRDQPRELVDMLFQHLLEPEHRPGANDGWRLAPAWEGRRGGA